jgi:beta-glucosidase
MATISTPIDFLGINNYHRMVIKAGRKEDGSEDRQVKSKGSEYTATDWEVSPDGLHDLLVRLHKDYRPSALHVTENGAAFDDKVDRDGQVHDPRRVAYYHAYISAACRATAEGVPLKGYFAWSLMDNFEWAEGYSKRFGIIYVDYKTQRRTIKDSGRWYASTIKANGPEAS